VPYSRAKAPRSRGNWESEQVKQRTAKVNQIRGLLTEYGIGVVQRVEVLHHALPQVLEAAENGLTADFRIRLEELKQDLVMLDERVDGLDKQIKTLANSPPDAKRLQQIPGLGPMIATAMVCAVGDGKQFKRGRDMAGPDIPAAQQRRQRSLAGDRQAG
jgi:transposase